MSFYLNNADENYPTFPTLIEALRASIRVGKVLATSPFLMADYHAQLRLAVTQEDAVLLTQWRRDNFE